MVKDSTSGEMILYGAVAWAVSECIIEGDVHPGLG